MDGSQTREYGTCTSLQVPFSLGSCRCGRRDPATGGEVSKLADRDGWSMGVVRRGGRVVVAAVE
jgi:hypothetical protein